MKSKYTILVQISLFMCIIAIGIAIANYSISLKYSEKQLKTISLPLSLDNIYTEIQKNIIEPYLVSSMMANDTFVHEWLKSPTQDKSKITEYLSSIKNKYNMFYTFLVSDVNKNYYTHNGLIESISKENKDNKWYFEFINKQNKHEINIDINKNLSSSFIMFINYKILDSQYKLIGATGVALKIEYINDMLKAFRQKYGFKVTFFNKEGKVILSELNHNNYKDIDTSNFLKPIKEKILSKKSNSIEIERNNQKYIIQTKYIEELDLYLIIEAKLSEYTSSVKEVLYFNLLAAMGIVLFIVIILYRLIQKHSKKLEDMAFYDQLTSIYNRRFFEKELLNTITNANRYKLEFCIVFIDIDNFKKVNDTKGHNIGDETLKEVSSILKETIRETDTIARWGGEEIIVLLANTNIKDAEIISEKLRHAIESNHKIYDILDYNLTASFGVTQFKNSDDINSIIKRADDAMYKSKMNGKNKVTVL